jgi:hypothetical protein
MANDFNTLKRRIQTLEAQMADLVERLSAYESGTEKNPNRALYLSDGKDGATAQVDFNAADNTLRITKVR